MHIEPFVYYFVMYIRLEIHYYWHYVRYLKYFCLFGCYVRF